MSAAPVDPASAAFIAWIGAARRACTPISAATSRRLARDLRHAVRRRARHAAARADGVRLRLRERPRRAGPAGGLPDPRRGEDAEPLDRGRLSGQLRFVVRGSPCRGDKHLLIVDADHRLLFETWNTRCLPADSPSCTWRAGSGAVFSLDCERAPPRRLDERRRRRPRDPPRPRALRRGVRRRADPPRLPRHGARHERVRVSRPRTSRARTRARRRWARACGSRRRRTSPDSRRRVQRIFQAMKTYGLIVADNGSDMYVQGTYDSRWDNGVLNPAFSSIHAGDFEVVQLGLAAVGAARRHDAPRAAALPPRGHTERVRRTLDRGKRLAHVRSHGLVRRLRDGRRRVGQRHGRRPAGGRRPRLLPRGHGHPERFDDQLPGRPDPGEQCPGPSVVRRHGACNGEESSPRERWTSWWT